MFCISGEFIVRLRKPHMLFHAKYIIYVTLHHSLSFKLYFFTFLQCLWH